MNFYDENDVVYNRFTNLDSVEDRIIYYLISEEGKTEEEKKLVHLLWRILYYNDFNALMDDEEHPLPKFSQIAKLIDNDTETQDNKRLFRYPFVEDAFQTRCSMLRIYIDSVIPVNHVVSTINVGIDIVIHNKLTNVQNNLYNEEGNPFNPTEEKPIITIKNRCTLLLKLVLALLNGKDIAGVGHFQFNQEVNRFNQARLAIWNNRNYFGYKLIGSCQMSGVN